MWDKITYLSPNVNSAIVEVWDRMINFILHLQRMYSLIHSMILVKPNTVVAMTGVI